MSASTPLTFCCATLSKRSTLMTNVPLPPVKLLKCFKYPTISLNGTRAVICLCRSPPSRAASLAALLDAEEPKGSGGA